MRQTVLNEAIRKIRAVRRQAQRQQQNQKHEQPQEEYEYDSSYMMDFLKHKRYRI